MKAQFRPAEAPGLTSALLASSLGCLEQDVRLVTPVFSGLLSVPQKSGSGSTLCALVQDSPKISWGELLPSRVPPAEPYLPSPAAARSGGAGRAGASSFKYFTD